MVEALVEIVAEDAGNALCKVAWFEVVEQFAVVVEAEGCFVVGQGHAAEYFLDMGEFYAVFLEEVASCWYVVKKVFYRD